jgi:hypothetical protein
MLELAGYNLDPMSYGFDPSHPGGNRLPAEAMIEAMRRARQALAQQTGQDFGFDLKAWHDYLISCPELGYTHPYAFRATRKFVGEAERDPVRCRLVTEMEGSGH